MRLTEDGEKLIDYARQMLQIEAAAFANVSRKALAGRIRFGIPDDYAEGFLPQIVTRFIAAILWSSCPWCATAAEPGRPRRGGEIDMAVVTDCAD